MYCIDTSSLISAWYELYPPDVLPPFWIKIEELIVSGRLIAPEPVRLEIEKQSDELYAWLNARSIMFKPLEENIQMRVRLILERFPRLVAQRKNRFAADPFVIALAAETDSVLVTEERPTGKTNNPNIPDVCRSNGFERECINVLGLMRKEKWVFG